MAASDEHTLQLLVELKLIVLAPVCETSRSSLVKHPITSADSPSFQNHKRKHQRQNAHTYTQTHRHTETKTHRNTDKQCTDNFDGCKQMLLMIKSDDDDEEIVQVRDPDTYIFPTYEKSTQTHNAI